jgi:hypothetical protein
MPDPGENPWLCPGSRGRMAWACRAEPGIRSAPRSIGEFDMNGAFLSALSLATLIKSGGAAAPRAAVPVAPGRPPGPAARNAVANASENTCCTSAATTAEVVPAAFVARDRPAVAADVADLQTRRRFSWLPRAVDRLCRGRDPLSPAPEPHRVCAATGSGGGLCFRLMLPP